MTSTISSATTTAPRNGAGNGQSLRSLWVSLLAGPVFYMIYFFIGYMLAEAACRLAFWQAPVLGLPSWVVVEMGLTMVTIAAIGVTGNIALRHWRDTRQQPSENSTVHFMAFGGIVLAPLFIYITLITGIFMLVLQPCSWV